MNKKTLPFSVKTLNNVAEKFGTPFHLYDENILEKRANALKKTFERFPGFKEFFAVKATPTPKILKIFNSLGFGADASSLTELVLSEKCGIVGEEIMFSSNGTKDEEFEKAVKLGAIINFDDISLADKFTQAKLKINSNTAVSFRINPGSLKKGNALIGNPVEAKYGITLDQLIPAYEKIKNLGAKKFGIHTMVVSNELNEDSFPETAKILIDCVLELKKKLNIDIDFINIGGGFGIPYKPEQAELNIENVANKIYKLFQTNFGTQKWPKLFMENGRWLTAPAGFLVSRVNSRKDIYKKYVVLDSCMADLMRPAIYGAYHHITIPERENSGQKEVVDIVGSLCENNDKFAIDREVPVSEINDFVVIHDAGAHGRAMGFNYNGKLRTQEILLKKDGSFEQIRRRESIDDYLATVIF